MNNRQRFLDVLNFKKPTDRIPMVEWAPWWNKTTDPWEEHGFPKGFPKEIDIFKTFDYFGLDYMTVLAASPIGSKCPKPAHHGAGVMTDEVSYNEIHENLFTQKSIDNLKEKMAALKPMQDSGKLVTRIWLDGFFWFPRKMFGIENHFYAFYDYPELMHRMNSELADFSIKTIRETFPILCPEMVGFAEDMSYNLGPMLSREQFNEFLLPYYQKVVPVIKEYGVKVFVDSDGLVDSMIPWLIEAGIEGIYPLERQSLVDINQIRKDYPKFLLLGGYDKMVMDKGEAAMRSEFERILPVMKSGGYIPSVDHQTPPAVTLEDYKLYIELFKEYCIKAVD